MVDRLTVTVTDRDVGESKANDCMRCALARAVSRAVRQPVWIDARGNVWIDPGWQTITTPANPPDYRPATGLAAMFIDWFDENAETESPVDYAEPFPLTLEFVAAGGAA